MANSTTYELIFTAKNATSGVTRQVTSEVAAVKNVAAGAVGAASQMREAYAVAMTNISDDVKNGTADIRAAIASQKNAIAALNKEYAQAQARFKTTAPGATKMEYGQHLAELRKEISGEEQALGALKQAQAQYAASTTSVRTQLMDLRNEMSKLRLEGKANTQEYEDKRQKLEQLGTVYRELQTEQKALSTGATQWGGAMSGLQGLMGAYSVGSGVISMFISDNEKLQAVQTKMQAVMATMMGMQQVANTLHATSAFRIVTVRKVTDLWRTAQNQMTGSLAAGTLAAKVFWGAVSLGATVVIGAAIAAISHWIDKNKEMREQAAETAKRIAEAEDSARKSAASSVAGQLIEYRKLQSAWLSLGNNMTAKAKFVKDNKTEFEKLGVAVGDVHEAENLLVTHEKDFVQTLQVRAMAMAAMEIAATKSKAALEKLLQAENPEITTDDLNGAQQAADTAATAALNDVRNKGSIQRGAVADQLPQIRQNAYNNYLQKLKKQRSAALADAANADLKEVSRLFATIQDHNGQIAEVMSSANIAPTNGVGTEIGKSKDPKSDIADYQLQLTRSAEDSERAILSEGWQKKIADANAAHTRWLEDATAANKEKLKIAEQNGIGTADITQKFNALVLAKDAEICDKRIDILKNYSTEAIDEYMRQTGDVATGTAATVAKLTTAKKTSIKIPEAAKVSLDSEVVASLKLRVEGIEEARKQIESLRSLMGMGNLTKEEQQGVNEAIGSWSDYARSLGYVEQKHRETNKVAADTSQAMGAIGSVVSATSGLVNAQAAGWVNWGAGVISAIASAIPSILALTVASREQANAQAASAVTGVAASAASIPFVGWILAGAAVASIIAAMASVPKFADGGIAYGPTLGLFGEYSGAQNNPEVVAPLDKLQTMLQPAGSGGVVRFRIEGRTLVGVLEKEDKHNRRTR
ncbi:MAG: hypothetical protein RR410_04835 [Alistipes sp.]